MGIDALAELNFLQMEMDSLAGNHFLPMTFQQMNPDSFANEEMQRNLHIGNDLIANDNAFIDKKSFSARTLKCANVIIPFAT